MQTQTTDTLSQTFAALADPTRRAMLARLSRGQTNVTDLAQPFLSDMSLPAVTKHLKVLERAGLVTKTREAQWRPCTLNGAPLKQAVAWMEQYRDFWEESLDRLGEYLAARKAQQAQGLPTVRSAPSATKATTRHRKRAGERHGRKK